MNLIAEIYRKVRGNTSNLFNRAEDELTGNFFGNMRYLPYTRGLKKIFDNFVKSPNDDNLLCILQSISDDKFEFQFWKRSLLGYGEIDGLISVGDVAIGIEVKLYSDLSGEDQLVREACMLNEWYTEKTKKLLLFVAPEDATRKVYEENYQEVMKKNVHLGYISWENICKGLDLVQLNSHYEELIVQDLKDLLNEKGFDSFEGFDTDIDVEEGVFYEFG